MKLCVVGAGAIGGYLAGKLALADHEVAVLARGAPGEAIRRDGCCWSTSTAELSARGFGAQAREAAPALAFRTP